MTWQTLFGNPINTKQPGKLVFRLADEQGSWSSKSFEASTPKALAKGIQRAWEEYIASHARGATHPGFAFVARQAEIRQWRAERAGRESTAEQRKSWDAQVAHWEWQAEHDLGAFGGKLGLHVRSNVYDLWIITTPGPHSAKPPRLVDEASAAHWLKWAAKWEEHDRNLAGLAGRVGDVVEEEMEKIEKARRRSKFRVVKSNPLPGTTLSTELLAEALGTNSSLLVTNASPHTLEALTTTLNTIGVHAGIGHWSLSSSGLHGEAKIALGQDPRFAWRREYGSGVFIIEDVNRMPDRVLAAGLKGLCGLAVIGTTAPDVPEATVKRLAKQLQKWCAGR